MKTFSVRLRIFCLFFYVIAYQKVASQDVKFSQYYASPLTVNPALCGIYSGKYRIQANFRDQWQNIQYPFITQSLSAENQLQSENYQDDILAIGFNALSDRSNNGGLRNNSFAANISFHKVLDQENYSRLGVGLQASYNSTIVDYSRMTFETQFTADGYNINLPTNELSNGFANNNLDYAAGVLYSYFSGDLNFYGGVSFFHLSQPTKNYGTMSYKVPMRTTLHAGCSFTVGEFNTVYISGMHMRTTQSNQTTVGLLYGLNINGGAREGEGGDNTANEFLIGSWMRIGDAIVPYLGLKIGNVQGGISYDITTSNITIANGGMGGAELSLNVLLNDNPNKGELRRLKCKFVNF